MNDVTREDTSVSSAPLYIQLYLAGLMKLILIYRFGTMSGVTQTPAGAESTPAVNLLDLLSDRWHY